MAQHPILLSCAMHCISGAAWMESLMCGIAWQCTHHTICTPQCALCPDSGTCMTGPQWRPDLLTATFPGRQHKGP